MRYEEETERELSQYIDIYVKINAYKHYEVNNYITANNRWDEFTKIRSINNHGLGKENILGIEPKYYKEICQRLKLTNGNGAALKSSKSY